MADTHTPELAPAKSAVKAQPARVQGEVVYRHGDGPTAVIRPGPVNVQTTVNDATLSWSEGDTHGSAAIPIAIFRRYVAQGAIKLHA